MNSIFRTKQFSFSAIYFLGWAALATFALDFIFYSERVGFTNTEIGLIYAFKILMGIIFQPLFGFICDYIRSTRKILIFMGIASVLLSCALPFAYEKYSVLVIVFVNIIAITAFMPLLDSWVARECIGEEKFHFGTLRLWGSIGYAVAAIAYGQMSMNIDVAYMYFGRAFFFILTILCIYKNEYDGSGLKVPISQLEKKDKPAVMELFAKKEYWLFFIFLFLFCFHVHAANTFFPKLLLENGSTTQIIALFGSINALAEVPFLMYARKLTGKVGARGMILIGGLFTVGRMLGFAFFTSTPLLLAAHLCLAPYVGFFIPGFIYYSYSIAPKHTQAFTLTSLQGLSMSFAGMLGALLGGIIVDRLGIQSMFGIYSLLCIAGLLMFLATGRWLKKRST